MPSPPHVKPLTEPQRRMLALFPERDSIQRWRLLHQSGSHNAGYRVIEALLDAGLIEYRNRYDQWWYGLTDLGRAARAP